MKSTTTTSSSSSSSSKRATPSTSSAPKKNTNNDHNDNNESSSSNSSNSSNNASNKFHPKITRENVLLGGQISTYRQMIERRVLPELPAPMISVGMYRYTAKEAMLKCPNGTSTLDRIFIKGDEVSIIVPSEWPRQLEERSSTGAAVNEEEVKVWVVVRKHKSGALKLWRREFFEVLSHLNLGTQTYDVFKYSFTELCKVSRKPRVGYLGSSGGGGGGGGDRNGQSGPRFPEATCAKVNISKDITVWIDLTVFPIENPELLKNFVVVVPGDMYKNSHKDGKRDGNKNKNRDKDGSAGANVSSAVSGNRSSSSSRGSAKGEKTVGNIDAINNDDDDDDDDDDDEVVMPVAAAPPPPITAAIIINHGTRNAPSKKVIKVANVGTSVDINSNNNNNTNSNSNNSIKTNPATRLIMMNGLKFVGSLNEAYNASSSSAYSRRRRDQFAAKAESSRNNNSNSSSSAHRSNVQTQMNALRDSIYASYQGYIEYPYAYPLSAIQRIQQVDTTASQLKSSAANINADRIVSPSSSSSSSASSLSSVTSQQYDFYRYYNQAQYNRRQAQQQQQQGHNQVEQQSQQQQQSQQPLPPITSPSLPSTSISSTTTTTTSTIDLTQMPSEEIAPTEVSPAETVIPPPPLPQPTSLEMQAMDQGTMWDAQYYSMIPDVQQAAFTLDGQQGAAAAAATAVAAAYVQDPQMHFSPSMVYYPATDVGAVAATGISDGSGDGHGVYVAGAVDVGGNIDGGGGGGGGGEGVPYGYDENADYGNGFSGYYGDISQIDDGGYSAAFYDDYLSSSQYFWYDNENESDSPVATVPTNAI